MIRGNVFADHVKSGWSDQNVFSGTMSSKEPTYRLVIHLLPGQEKEGTCFADWVRNWLKWNRYPSTGLSREEAAAIMGELSTSVVYVDGVIVYAGVGEFGGCCCRGVDVFMEQEE